jgi:hypothetical protein
MGVAATAVGGDARTWPDAWRALQPTLLLALDDRDVLAALGGERLAAWAAAGGCRLLVHRTPSGFPHSDRRDAADAARLADAASGRSADAFCSLYEPEYFDRYAAAWRDAGFRYLALPQACDPFQDVPLDRPRRAAYVMVSALTRDRLAVADATLRPVLRAHPGLWAGSGWRFGLPRVPATALPGLFADARVALAPLVPFLRDQPLEITYRVFAAAACGAFQITHRTPITDRFFAAGELVQAADDREFAALYAHYLPRPQERTAVALRALHRVYRDHTIFERASRLVAFAREWSARR